MLIQHKPPFFWGILIEKQGLLPVVQKWLARRIIAHTMIIVLGGDLCFISDVHSTWTKSLNITRMFHR